jgi:cytosine permease
MVYVGTLSYLAGRSGKNFELTAANMLGSKGFRIVSAFLSTLVIGWFAFQTGRLGSTLNLSMGWSAAAPSPGLAWSLRRSRTAGALA